MGKRIFFGLLLIAFVCGVFYADWFLQSDQAWCPFDLSPLPLTLLTAGLIIVGYIEFRRMIASAGVQLPLATGMLCCLVIGTMPFWWPVLMFVCEKSKCSTFVGLMVLPADIAVVGLLLGVVFLEQLARHRLEDILRRLALTFLAVGYLGVCGHLVLSIRTVVGLKAFVLFLAAVKCSDIGAYFTGKFLGRHKLVEWLSPKKTWEGFFGGLAFAACVSLVLNRVMWMDMAPWSAAVFGLAMGALGQGADLCESALKRAAGVKDAGAVLPEFGGVLDILDSLLLTAPAALVLLSVLTMGHLVL